MNGDFKVIVSFVQTAYRFIISCRRVNAIFKQGGGGLQ